VSSRTGCAVCERESRTGCACRIRAARGSALICCKRVSQTSLTAMSLQLECLWPHGGLIGQHIYAAMLFERHSMLGFRPNPSTPLVKDSPGQPGALYASCGPRDEEPRHRPSTDAAAGGGGGGVSESPGTPSHRLQFTRRSVTGAGDSGTPSHRSPSRRALRVTVLRVAGHSESPISESPGTPSHRLDGTVEYVRPPPVPLWSLVTSGPGSVRYRWEAGRAS
jgi:hypothetical protein